MRACIPGERNQLLDRPRHYLQVWHTLLVERIGNCGNYNAVGLGSVCEGVDAPPEAVTTTGTNAAIVCEMAAANALAITGVSDVNRFATLAVTASALTA